jgi:hypothetical protein
MRKFQAALIALAASAALATTAHADDGDTHGYGSIGWQHADFGGFGKGLEALSLSGALNIWKFVSVEGDLAVGAGSKRTDFGGVTAKTKLEHDLAAYAVASYPASRDIDLFARVGFMQAKAEAHGTGLSSEQTVSGPAFGVGVHYFPNGGKNGVALELNHADFGRNGHGNIGQLSFVHRF